VSKVRRRRRTNHPGRCGPIHWRGARRLARDLARDDGRSQGCNTSTRRRLCSAVPSGNRYLAPQSLVIPLGVDMERGYQYVIWPSF
jgi:hypothetical protein